MELNWHTLIGFCVGDEHHNPNTRQRI